MEDEGLVSGDRIGIPESAPVGVDAAQQDVYFSPVKVCRAPRMSWSEKVIFICCAVLRFRA